MKNLSIAGKLYLSFSVVILLTIIMGGVSIWRLNSVSGTFIDLQNKYFKIADYGMESKILLLTARRHEKDFLARKDEKYVPLMDQTLSELGKMATEMISISKNLGLNQFASIGNSIIASKDQYLKAFKNVAALISERGNKDVGIAGNLRAHGHDAEAKIKKLKDKDLMIEYLSIRRHEKDMILREDVKYLDKANNVFKNIEKYSSKNLSSEDMGPLLKDFSDYIATFKLLSDNISGVKKEYPVMRNSAHEVEKYLMNLEKDIMEIVKVKEDSVLKEKNSTVVFLYIIGFVIVILCFVLSFISVRSISGPLNSIIRGLNHGADQVSRSAEQVFTSSRILAEGSSEQAASIEETSASMEEMSSMTGRNAENASNANKLMGETNQVVSEAEGSMHELTGAMGEITKASEEISKIIKTIDEIAFQTNLLALNAAVEAARAGEAGAGFAVVADEVRNLAMRASDAAKNTAELIEGTVHKIEEGSKIVENTSLAFSNVAESSSKIGAIVAEISEASKEQANGISQVNITISEMDRVIQQNASSAESSANASEELKMQSTLLMGYMRELIALASGSDGKVYDRIGSVEMGRDHTATGIKPGEKGEIRRITA